MFGEYVFVSYVVVQSFISVQLFVTPWSAACWAPLSSAISWSLLKLIEPVMLFNHLFLCHPHLLLPSVFLSIRVFFNELALRTRWTKYWSFSFNIRPSNEYSGLISFRIDWFDLCCSRDSQAFSSTTIWKHQFFSAQPSLWFNSHIHMWLLEKP